MPDIRPAILPPPKGHYTKEKEINIVRCPYCGAISEIEGFSVRIADEDKRFVRECIDCRKLFVFEVSIRFDFDSYEADCLNTEDTETHDWSVIPAIPTNRTEMKCRDCRARRDLTPQEWIDIYQAELEKTCQ